MGTLLPLCAALQGLHVDVADRYGASHQRWSHTGTFPGALVVGVRVYVFWMCRYFCTSCLPARACTTFRALHWVRRHGLSVTVRVRVRLGACADLAVVNTAVSGRRFGYWFRWIKLNLYDARNVPAQLMPIYALAALTCDLEVRRCRC